MGDFTEIADNFRTDSNYRVSCIEPQGTRVTSRQTEQNASTRAAVTTKQKSITVIIKNNRADLPIIFLSGLRIIAPPGRKPWIFSDFPLGKTPSGTSYARLSVRSLIPLRSSLRSAVRSIKSSLHCLPLSHIGKNVLRLFTLTRCHTLSAGMNYFREGVTPVECEHTTSTPSRVFVL